MHGDRLFRVKSFQSSHRDRQLQPEMLLAGPGSLHTTCAKLMHTLSMVLPCGPFQSESFLCSWWSCKMLLNSPFLEIPGFSGTGIPCPGASSEQVGSNLSPAVAQWARRACVHNYGMPTCLCPDWFTAPGVASSRAGTPCPFGQGAVTYGQDEHHGPVLEPSKHLQLGTASISCQSVSLLGRPGAAGTSPARSLPPAPSGPALWRLLCHLFGCLTHGTSLTPQGRPGHLRLETCALDPGSRQGHWQPPGSCAVSCDGRVCDKEFNWRKVGGAQEAGRSPRSCLHSLCPFLSSLLRACLDPAFSLPASCFSHCPLSPPSPPLFLVFLGVCVYTLNRVRLLRPHGL